MRLPPFALLALVALPAAAQRPDSAARATGATITGTVYDSLARAPLAGATVQLVPADGAAREGRVATADSLGRYTIAGVPNGRFALGFFHPMLDSLGLDAPLREVFVVNGQPVRADLGTPSPARFRTAVCTAVALSDSAGVVVGVVRDARDGDPVPDAVVTGEWLELSFTVNGLVRRVPRLSATTGENGWFALCNVPSAGTMTIRAARGADSTDVIELPVPAAGFVRRELWLGASRTLGTVDTAARRDSLAPPPRRVHVGEGRLSGTVVAHADGRPVVGAQVGIVDGPQTRTNERGEWTLANAPAGTRMLQVRAVTFYPERRAVDVVAGAPPVRVALSTLKAVLDTVRVTARYDRERSGFQQRRRSGIGRFLTAEDIARRQPLETSQLFRMMPGMRVDTDSGVFDVRILMRGLMESWCSPGVYVNGHQMMSLAGGDLDEWVRPADIAAMEIYASGQVPAQYQRMDGCGAIVIWTK